MCIENDDIDSDTDINPRSVGDGIRERVAGAGSGIGSGSRKTSQTVQSTCPHHRKALIVYEQRLKCEYARPVPITGELLFKACNSPAKCSV
ncbi:hypothetical protein CYMTET_48200 [Cymbomonas tetramitiformis]|uniref:Uncharacterized protein n=1 Tax=Cymbomonas tetramitiformis TaxID=36881 RepID=A0AAE0BSQ5_9CHLO|nr:hypothetical protein CYMTET_48200 [Cymbomonas tetramitiformis]